jgi:hypothetical protein
MDTSPTPQPINFTSLTPDYNLPTHLFARLFPFFLTVNQNLQVVQVGDALQKVCPALEIGNLITQHVQLHYPTVPLDFLHLKEASPCNVVLNISQQQLQLRGQSLYLEQQEVIVFLTSPWVEGLPALYGLGTKLSEASAKDSIADLLFLLQARSASVEQTQTMLNQLNQMGISIAIDDFGTGYSSLGYLKRFPFHTLKIDQTFVRDLTTDPNDKAIVAAILAMGKVLNLRLVAEGVETRVQEHSLLSLNCEEMQGYLFSHPLPAEDATRLLTSNLGVCRL